MTPKILVYVDKVKGKTAVRIEMSDDSDLNDLFFATEYMMAVCAAESPKGFEAELEELTRRAMRYKHTLFRGRDNDE